MKTAVLLHGTGGNDNDYYWFGDTRDYLNSKGYEVWWPQLPDTQRPELEPSLSFVEHNVPLFGEDSIIVAHSSGCPLALRYLEELDFPIKQVILVAGFYEPIDETGFSALMLPDRPFKWTAIRAAAREIILINSNDDPWGCTYDKVQPVAKAIGAQLILAEGQGHMGSATFHQPYGEFPMLKQLLAI